MDDGDVNEPEFVTIQYSTTFFPISAITWPNKVAADSNFTGKLLSSLVRDHNTHTPPAYQSQVGSLPLQYLVGLRCTVGY